jgi:hypothetical protein
VHPHLRQAIAETHIAELRRVADQRRTLVRAQPVCRALFGRLGSRIAASPGSVQVVIASSARC